MRQQRWFGIVALAVGLFAINAITRVVIRVGFSGSDTAETRASVIMFALIGIALAVGVTIRSAITSKADTISL